MKHLFRMSLPEMADAIRQLLPARYSRLIEKGTLETLGEFLLGRACIAMRLTLVEWNGYRHQRRHVYFGLYEVRQPAGEPYRIICIPMAKVNWVGWNDEWCGPGGRNGTGRLDALKRLRAKHVRLASSKMRKELQL